MAFRERKKGRARTIRSGKVLFARYPRLSENNRQPPPPSSSRSPAKFEAKGMHCDERRKDLIYRRGLSFESSRTLLPGTSSHLPPNILTTLSLPFVSALSAGVSDLPFLPFRSSRPSSTRELLFRQGKRTGSSEPEINSRERKFGVPSSRRLLTTPRSSFESLDSSLLERRDEST